MPSKLCFHRLDFLATYAAEHIDGGLIARELETILGCQVSLDKGLEGKETKANTGSQGTYNFVMIKDKNKSMA